MRTEFWRDKRVLLTGHTGFKGSWLSLWLQSLGANVAGYSLPPEETGSLFESAAVARRMASIFGDIRDVEHLQEVCVEFRPEIVFHLAAQALVRRSYAAPIDTYDVNVMGTVSLLEAVRRSETCRVVVNITSDKCYENKEWTWGYRENDELGGHDPYSSSKACAEIVTAAYRRSFFGPQSPTNVAVASARAGNVIGGGDFAKDRIVPDFIAAAYRGVPLHVRYPNAVRPWQHVLEPLSGYLLLAEKLWEEPTKYAGSWNFGPSAEGIRTVGWVVEQLNDYCGRRIVWNVDSNPQPHEARMLTLDSAKARSLLGWKPRWTVERALKAAAEWYDAHAKGESSTNLVLRQIDAYSTSDILQ